MAIAISATHQFVSAIADSGDTSLLQPSNWNAAHTGSISGLTADCILYSTDTTTLAQSTGLKWGPTAGLGLQIAAGTATTDVAALSITRTNNNAAVATGVKITFTDTTSASGFLPFQILGGSAGTTNLLSIGKSGIIGLNGGGTITPLGGILYIQASSGGSTFAQISDGLYNTVAAGVFGWASNTNGGSAPDTGISRSAAGIVAFGTGSSGNGQAALFLSERTAPSAPASNSVHIYAVDNGAGKTQLMALFNSGAAQQIAIEP